MKSSVSPAIVFPEPGRVVVDEVAIPPMTGTDVSVEIEYTSISNGTERWCLTGQLKVPGAAPLAFGHVPGYQAAGVVREVGAEVEGFECGDRVFSRNCREPEGWQGSWWGGHVGWHVADYREVIRLPAGVSAYEAAGLLLAQVGYNGASKPSVQSGDVAVVIGAGLVGQYAGQVLRYRGAQVIMADVQEFRLRQARQYSADEVFNCAEGDLTAFVRERCPDGVAIALDTASCNQTVRTAIELLRNGGQLVLNGFYPEGESRLDWHWLRSKEITTYCPNSRTRSRLENTLQLIEQGHVRMKELVTHEMDLCDAPEAYEMLLEGVGEFLGMVLRWDGGS